jgi:hypothetical protein
MARGRLKQAFDTALRRAQAVAFADLAEEDRVLVAIWALEADVNNGGFDQYYFNSSGDTAYYAPTALRLIAEWTATGSQCTPEGASRPRGTW